MHTRKPLAGLILANRLALGVALVAVSAVAGASSSDSVRVELAYINDAAPGSASAPSPRRVGPALVALPQDGQAVTYTDTRKTTYRGGCAGAVQPQAQDTGFTAGLKLLSQDDKQVIVDADFNVTEFERLNVVTVGNCFVESPVISGKRISGTFSLPLTGDAVLIPVADGAHVGLRLSKD